MSLFSWFSKSKKSAEEDYEQVLASLALAVQRRQTRLSELRLRERRSTLFATTWTFGAWVAYVALWWAGAMGARRGVVWGLPVVVGPVLILFTRRVVQLWYTRIGNAEEKTLKELLVKQRNKIEEIKKKTNYYSTKSLLDRYDDGHAAKSKPTSVNGQASLRRSAPPQSINTQHAPSATSSAVNFPPQTPVRDGQQPIANANAPYSPALPLLPPRKQWYDKLADALLGDDTASTGALPSTRYALICQRCFSHNGLVKEELWEDAQYLCPKCGHFNQSARARKALMSPAMSQSAVSAASVPLPQSVVASTGSMSQSVSAASTSSASAPATEPLSHLPRHIAPLLAPNQHEKSPLSESTVIVEKSDATEGDGGVEKRDDAAPVVGYDAERMDVDS